MPTVTPICEQFVAYDLVDFFLRSIYVKFRAYLIMDSSVSVKEKSTAATPWKPMAAQPIAMGGQPGKLKEWSTSREDEPSGPAHSA